MYGFDIKKQFRFSQGDIQRLEALVKDMQAGSWEKVTASEVVRELIKNEFNKRGLKLGSEPFER